MLLEMFLAMSPPGFNKGASPGLERFTTAQFCPHAHFCFFALLEMVLHSKAAMLSQEIS